MKKEAPRLPGLPTMAALMLSVLIAVWLGLFGPLNLAAIEKWQTLVSASVAAMGIAVAALIAVRNVSRQIRINILLREEDRIEKHLPGLRDASLYLARLSAKCDCEQSAGGGDPSSRSRQARRFRPGR